MTGTSQTENRNGFLQDHQHTGTLTVAWSLDEDPAVLISYGCGCSLNTDQYDSSPLMLQLQDLTGDYWSVPPVKEDERDHFLIDVALERRPASIETARRFGEQLLVLPAFQGLTVNVRPKLGTDH
ncbi:hypothetical protein CYG49_03180 [Candidatus Saccharibacteria bacterium]|nr:MAG: hypothetical protein CYG49_03180 [Candidatus Saccharibacteria bacterium]